MRVLVAGAGGVIGTRLVPRLVGRGHEVVATMRDATRGGVLRGTGATVVSMDGLDAASVGEAVARAEPDVIVHEMSALKGADDLRRFDDEFALTNELRTSGTDHCSRLPTRSACRGSSCRVTPAGRTSGSAVR
jgi:nucleoside-diphosphate-sugar epimerase